MSLVEAFKSVFEGNPTAHYTWKPGEYSAISRGITEADVERHLGGDEPGLLSIPVLASGLCHFAAGDCDRHLESDESIDFAEVARKITELALPLIVTRSKSPKSCHIWLFFMDVDGFDCAIARRLIEKYMKLLGISGEIEIFPKQEKLKVNEQTGEMAKGSGINLPYFGNTRTGFGIEGEELDLEGFLKLVEKRQSFGKVLAQRDIENSFKESESINEKDRPLPIVAIRRIHEKYLKDLLASNELGHWNDTINETAFFAGRAFAAKALVGTANEVKNAIRKAAKASSGQNERQMESTLDSGWESGILQPLKILDPVKAHDDALEWSEWVFKKDSIVPERTVAYETAALLTKEELEPLIKEMARRLGVRASLLEEFIKARRVKQEEGAVDAISFREAEPWPEPVDGLQLLKDISALLRRFIVFNHNFEAELMSTWALGSHLYEEFYVFPRLGFTSPVPECGKTTCLDLMEQLCLRAVRADNVSTAIIYRIIEKFHPSLFLDELDTYLHDRKEMQGIINSGHRKGGFVWRMNTENDKMILEKFGTYGPFGFGMIGQPNQTLQSRSVFVRLERKSSTQDVQDCDPDENPEQEGEITVLRRKLIRWAMDHRPEVKGDIIDTRFLENRNRNNWKPLLKLSHLIGGGWADMMFGAAGIEAPAVKKSDNEKMIRDIRDIFHTRKVERIPSLMLVDDLCALEGSSWKRYHNNRDPIDVAEMSEILSEFGLVSKPLRYSAQEEFAFKVEKGKQRRGYTAKQFEPLYAQYLKDEPEEVEINELVVGL